MRRPRDRSGPAAARRSRAGQKLDRWCHVCCSPHGNDRECPGELEATGTEVPGWRVNVDTGSRVEAFGVLVAPSNDLWRARILTYPSALWVVPGAHATIKFFGETEDVAKEQAIQFVRRHCAERGYRVRGDEAAVELSNQPPPRAGAENRRSPRVACFHHVRFGLANPSEPGGTGDLSEHGLYVITEDPLDSGSPVNLSIELAHGDLRVGGTVRWARKRHYRGRAPGMGVQIDSPPDEYLRYVRSLR